MGVTLTRTHVDSLNYANKFKLLNACRQKKLCHGTFHHASSFFLFRAVSYLEKKPNPKIEKFRSYIRRNKR